MKKVAQSFPNGVDLLKLLIELLAEQEGVTVKYEIETRAAA